MIRIGGRYIQLPHPIHEPDRDGRFEAVGRV